MAIICAWTTGVLCIKNGIYHHDALENEQAEEEDFFSWIPWWSTAVVWKSVCLLRSPPALLATVQTAQIEITIDVRVSTPLRLRFSCQTLQSLGPQTQLVLQFQDLRTACLLKGTAHMDRFIIEWLLLFSVFRAKMTAALIENWGRVLMMTVELRLVSQLFLEVPVYELADEPETGTLLLLLPRLLCPHSFLPAQMLLGRRSPSFTFCRNKWQSARASTRWCHSIEPQFGQRSERYKFDRFGSVAL